MDKKSILSKFISTQGYKRNSPDVNNPINVIPSNQITMENVDFPVVGVDNLGNQIVMQPGQNYTFPGDYVVETPIAQDGGSLQPIDYQQFLEYNKTAPSNRQISPNYKYGNPRDYDHYGMWEALGKPKDFTEAKQKNPDWLPNDEDGLYHGLSVNPNTGIYLKSHVAGEYEPNSTTWMEYMAEQLSNKDWGTKYNQTYYDPEIQRLRTRPKMENGGWLDSYQKGSEVVPPMFRKYIPEQPTTRQMTFAEYKQQLSNNYDEATVNAILQSKQMTNYKPNDIVGTYNTSIPQRKPTQKEIDIQNRQVEILSKDKYFNEDGSRNKNIISGINWTPEGRTELAGMQAKAQIDWEQLPWQDKAKSIGTDVALAAFLDLGLGAKMLKGIGAVGKNLFKTGEKINIIDNAIKPITTSTNNIVEQTTKQPCQLEELPGLHLKSTMRGSPLEKQLSKSGEININSVKAYLSKSEVGSQDKFILNKVLNEKFAGQNKINYNDLRKYVSDELIPLNKRFTEDYADYGINALGYLKKTNLGDPFYKNIPLPKENTSIVFSNKNKFGFGSNAHFSDDTLGHSRILVSNEEPDVMHILESQSDYYQKGIPKITKEQAETNLNRMEQLANNQDALMSEAIQLPNGTYKYKDGTIVSKELFESGNN